jgi:hypothetical protein
MTPQRAARLVESWVRCYTRHLPAPVAGRRAGEIRADLHDHIAHERALGTGDGRIALGVLSRMIRGLPADASWRGRIRPWRKDIMKSFAAILAAVLAVVVLGAVAMLYGGSDDAPGLVLIGLLLILAAIAVAVRTAYRRGRDSAGRTGTGRPSL